MNNLFHIFITLSFIISAGCAIQGSKAAEKYESESNCPKPASFTCGNKKIISMDHGVDESAHSEKAQHASSISDTPPKYQPLCRLKNDKCECACEPASP